MKTALRLALAAALFPLAVCAAPSGFNDAPEGFGAPQGFQAEKMTVAQIKASARDDQLVRLDGAFTKQVGKRTYLFTDLNGDSIEVELDKKRDWSVIVKDRPMELTAEVDRDWNKIELEAVDVRPISKFDRKAPAE
jgi:uncharacterized protein (TIGR00156 family)